MIKTFSLVVLTILFSLHLRAQHNVVLIIADDLGTDYFGFYEDHQDTVDVPHIRALLSKGVRFSNATSNPVCSATRAGMLTGRYSFRTGVGGIVGGGGGSGQLDTSEVTIPRLLKIYNPDIAKANIGKWHLHQPVPMGNLLFPNVLGYDHFEGPFIGQLTSYTNWVKFTNGVQSTVTHYATSENVDNGVTWLKNQDSKPVFMWMAFNAPHAPIHLPPADLHTYDNLSGTTGDIATNPKPYFKAMLQSLDTEIGRFMDSLQIMNRLDSTDFIFIGDNGNTARTAQVADTSRAKGTIYQYGVHVPFIISGPSVENPGRTSDALVNTQDLFATILELMGDTDWATYIPGDSPVDSKSLLPILKDQATSVRPWAFTENFKLIPDSTDGKAMRNMDYKLLRFDYGKEEFYHLASDPLELNNLLDGTLNAAELSNYQYLCNEMATLLGSNNFCDPAVRITPVSTTPALLAYPNPFSAHIFVQPINGLEEYVLADSRGQLVFTGKQIEKQDFSGLPSGVYFLKIKLDEVVQVVKLIKE